MRLAPHIFSFFHASTETAADVGQRPSHPAHGSRWLIVFFAVVLLAPAFQMATGIFHTPDPRESRYRANRPSTAELSTNPPRYIELWRKWFNDNYGMRDLLIRARAQIDFSLFGVSRRVYVGSHGWLYDREVLDVWKASAQAMTDEQLDQAAGSIADLGGCLARRGVTLIVVANQLKDRFYPEHLPRGAPHYGSRQRFDVFREKLSAVLAQRAPGVLYIDATPILEDLKTRQPIFHRTDFYWSDPAALEVGQHIVDALAAREGKPTPFWRVPTTIETRRFRGGEARDTPLFSPPSERAVFIAARPSRSEMNLEFSDGPVEYVYRAAGDRPDLLPPLAMLSDSFYDSLDRSGFAWHFQKLARSRWWTPLADVLTAMEPDTKYFMLQFIETRAPRLSELIGDALKNASICVAQTEANNH
jgi:hypothetical protein